MPSRERPSEALAADHGDAPREVTDSDGGQPPSETTAAAPASLAQAEAEAAEAEARAETAGAHAMRLRLRVEEARSQQREGELRDVGAVSARRGRPGRAAGGCVVRDRKPWLSAPPSCSFVPRSGRVAIWCGITAPPCVNDTVPQSFPRWSAKRCDADVD
jgi:hypothetical protein